MKNKTPKCLGPMNWRVMFHTLYAGPL
jgi:hypothetical protein